MMSTFENIPPPPEQYLHDRCREAYSILSQLNTSFGQKLPTNVYMAMAYLHIQVVEGAPRAGK